MNVKSKAAAAGMAVFTLAVACSEVTEVTTTDLEGVVARDGVPFLVQSIPDEVLDRLSQHKLVVVGETHLIWDHQEMMAELVRALHERGFRQLLLEWPHMADWILTDFVQDTQLEPDWQPPGWFYSALIAAVRDFNRTLPQAERVAVRGIDMNLQEYGGAQDFKGSLSGLSHHLTDPGPVAAFLQSNYETSGEQVEQLETLRAALETGRSTLIDSWGEYWYDTVAEMVEVERASVPIRAMREDRYDLTAQMREAVMKLLADARLRGYEHGTLMNVGGNHAQKAYLKGTEQEWLGDYLVHRSDAVGGSAIVLNVTAARIVSGSGNGSADFDVTDASPENELWRLMNETWPDQIVFLPVNDPVFLGDGVPMNFEGTIYVGSPKRHYDVFLLLPLAHRVPLP
jgi:hypothetical protein